MQRSPTISIEPRPQAAAATADEHTVVWRYLRALGASRAEADDLAQDTMVTAVAQGRGPDRPADDRADRSFRLGVARNLWLRSRRWWQRQREREVAAAVDELWQATANHDGGDELLADLRECLEHLQPRARTALDLHYRDGLAWPEVAARVDLKPNGIKTLAQRARRALRDCIERRRS